MADEQRRERREAIKAILRAEDVGTQEELVQLLKKRGFDVTQATLSRDLAKLNARRITRPEGGVSYELEDFQAPIEDAALAGLMSLVTSVEHNDSLVVVFTTAGGASAVALAIDRARLPSVLGTIAGDDTIFVAPARKSSASGLAKQLQSLWRRNTK